jgi:hypothetical protein
LTEAQIHGRLTNTTGRNIITSIRGSKRQVADIKSEPRPASNRNRWPASYWNAWPASSESAASHLIPFDELVTGNYEAFLAARANLVLDALKTLCGVEEQAVAEVGD